MRSEVYRQFPEKIKDYSRAYEKLNQYLLGNGIANKIAQPKFESDSVKIRGKLEDNLEFYAEFSPVLFSCLRKEKSQMRGGIFFKNFNKETTEKAKNIAKLLIDYEL